jgi:hypothetical protein
MGTKRTLPPVTSGRRKYRPNYGITQKKERDAIDAAIKRSLGNDDFEWNSGGAARVIGVELALAGAHSSAGSA